MRRAVLALLSVLAVAACAEPAAQIPPPAVTQPAKQTKITLAFAGDVHFAGRTADLLKRPETAFGKAVKVLSYADLALINLETAVTTRGTPEPKSFHFRTPASAFTAVKAAGIDAVSLANNHALDYGQVGLADTLAAARAAGIPALGAGRADTAYQPWVVDLRGTKVAVIALSHVPALWQSWRATDRRPGLAYLRDDDRAFAAIKQARAQADVVAVFVHWDPEYVECPNVELKRLAKRLSEAGADIVIGGGQHLPLGAGWLGKTYVAYGLGNFLWWRNDAMSNDTGIIWLTIDEKKVIDGRFIPIVVDRKTGQPIPASGKDAERIAKEQNRLRTCAGLLPLRP